MRFRQGAVALMLAGVLGGCVAPAKNSAPVPAAAAACPAENTMIQTTLYFGLSRPAGKDVRAQEWQQFVDRDVTPRFREGLTVFDARGQWLGNDGTVAREQSKALMLIHGTDGRSEEGIEALRNRYKSRFAQESVMRVDQPVCVHF
ncbi:TPA: DUF3574 domain-containing protein [Raoultella planticola]